MKLDIVIIMTVTVTLIGGYIHETFTYQDPYPSWVDELIQKEKTGPVASPPASISKCVYKNQSVFYFPPSCCDNPSTLFDEYGKSICQPDGGSTGGGDGKCLDFHQESTDCLVVWKDTRSEH